MHSQRDHIVTTHITDRDHITVDRVLQVFSYLAFSSRFEPPQLLLLPPRPDEDDNSANVKKAKVECSMQRVYAHTQPLHEREREMS